MLEITQWGMVNNQQRIIILQNAQKRRDSSIQDIFWENPDNY